MGEQINHDETLKNFVKDIALADGRLLALLNGKSRLGEPLFISARFGVDEITPNISYLNVDVFAKKDMITYRQEIRRKRWLRDFGILERLSMLEMMTF